MMRHAVDCLRAKVNKPRLLPDRTVLVDSFASKEAVMHHADPQHQDDREKKRHKDYRHNLK